MASRSRKSKGRTAQKVVWFFVVAGLIFAFFQIPYDPGVKGIWGIAESKAETVQSWVESSDDGIVGFVEKLIKGGSEQPSTGNGNPGLEGVDGSRKPGDAPPPEIVTEAEKSLNKIITQEASNVNYDRNEWKHWTSHGQSCWNVREEVLARQATPGTLKLEDKNKQPTTSKEDACGIVSGEWADPYTGKTFTDPSALDIDHMIPLSYAARHGGQAWDGARKEKYANSLDYSNHLIAVSAGANRSKGDKGPASWKPENKNHWCTYATDWTFISTNWGLSTTEADKQALTEMLGTCSR